MHSARCSFPEPVLRLLEALLEALQWHAATCTWYMQPEDSDNPGHLSQHLPAGYTWQLPHSHRDVQRLERKHTAPPLVRRLLDAAG